MSVKIKKKVAVVTDHAEDRIRKRLGLNRKTVQRQANAALNRGHQQQHYTGSMKRFLDRIYKSPHPAQYGRVYNGYVYYFHGVTLITVIEVPKHLRKVKPKT